MAGSALSLFLSEPRFSAYLSYVADRYPELERNVTEQFSIELYRWNVRAAATVMADISYVEVFVRNSIDHEIREWLATQKIEGFFDWVSPRPMDPIGRIRNLVNTADKDYLESARISALNKQRQWRSDQSHPRHGDQINRDDVFAQLNFGTWDGMLSRSVKDPELMEVLLNAFPSIESAWTLEQRRMPHAKLPGSEGDDVRERLCRELANRLRSIRNIRNRASHEDNLLRVDFPQLRRNMFFVLGSLGRECIGLAFPDRAQELKAMSAERVLKNLVQQQMRYRRSIDGKE
ncbi:Abi family protein [Bifidobacterium callimiconis]|uniref:Abi family protein n=1 Tax=Bifidobacterium callimiconis TaxID=2306973 RepID=UPI001BDCC882|nr:Abi family protein [Bifidobacterium callimiconis]MBT1177160.1 Abi family protein [Bifidobacterium callimiconis]